MKVKALLAMPTWWCFVGNHTPLVRVGDGFVQLDYERVARDVRIGLIAIVWAVVMGAYFVGRDGDWSLLMIVPLGIAFFGSVMVFLLVSTMKSLASSSVYNALPVPLVRYDPDSIPMQYLFDIGESDQEAAVLMREMLNMAWHVPTRWWQGFGGVADDISHRFGADDIRDWLNRRELHRARVYALERRISKTK